ncbi:glycoside hydrolase family 113 [Polyangium spumosum]|uniref:glycoside hydrolase family 113 n=1 Tax=Polyangium spumosum TaxID=889282 RepID=UPI00308449C8
MRTHLAAASLFVLAASATTAAAAPVAAPRGAAGWADEARGGIRGVTIGPIESLRHPDKGYGTRASARAMDEAKALGSTWISLTPFGRVWDLKPSGIDLTFEAPFEQNREDVLRAMHQAHARGLKVFLVPHLWVETGGWRALIDPGDDAAWARWAAAYRHFLLTWARVAAEGGAEMLSVGVELRSFVTTGRAALFYPILEEVRRVYPGLLTYSANWDDAEDTLIFGELDLVGINAFYPLADKDGAGRDELHAGGRRVAEGIERLAAAWGKPVVLTEIGYTTRKDPAVRPWEWPDGMKNVTIDEEAQALAYEAIIAPLLDSRACAGFFVWRYYADPDDVSQESEWGFSPRGKLAELVLRDAFTARWAADGPSFLGENLGRHRARTPGLLGWELSPPPAWHSSF